MNGVLSVGSAFEEIMQYINTRQVEMTKREPIRAHRDIEIQKIRSAEKIVLNYLDTSFTEGKMLFKELFERADRAIADNDADALDRHIQGIVAIAEDSPFRNITNLGSICKMREDVQGASIPKGWEESADELAALGDEDDALMPDLFEDEDLDWWRWPGLESLTHPGRRGDRAIRLRRK